MAPTCALGARGIGAQARIVSADRSRHAKVGHPPKNRGGAVALISVVGGEVAAGALTLQSQGQWHGGVATSIGPPPSEDGSGDRGVDDTVDDIGDDGARVEAPPEGAGDGGRATRVR